MNHNGTRQRVANPVDNSNVFGQIFFLYTIKLFKFGHNKALNEKTIPETPTSLKSKKLTDKVENKFKLEKFRSQKPFILKVLLQCFGVDYFVLGLGILVVKLISVNISLYTTGKLISYFSLNSNLTKKAAHIYAAVSLSLIFIEFLYQQNYLVKLAVLKIRIRTVLCSLIYRKALRVSEHQIKNSSIGKVVTLITKDVATFESFLDNANEIWMSFFKSGVTCTILYSRLGISSIVAILSCLIFTPIQIYLSFKVANLKKGLFKQTDKRLQATNEILFAIKIIKMFTWERFFKEKVIHFRESEMQYTYKIFLLKFLMAAVSIIHIHLTFVFLMGLYKHLGNITTVELVYFAYSYYRFLSYPISTEIPQAIFETANVVVAASRIDKFLATEEVENFRHNNFCSARVSVENLTIETGDKMLLKNVNLNVDSGINVITGPVGCGKTVFLKTILQECKPSSGNILAEGTISYASQEPWLFPSTLRQNIVFGQTYDENRYKEIVRVCCLDYDFSRFQKGDQTIVENHGMNLSQGQQIRINLARCIYRDAQIYLLDDCLANLDKNVKKIIFKECLQNFLRNKLIILVTNDKDLFKETANIFLIKNHQLLNVNTLKNGKPQDTEIMDYFNIDGNLNPIMPQSDDESSRLLTNTHPSNIYEEVQNVGQVSSKIYKKIIKCGGGYIFLITIVLIYALKELSQSYLSKSVSIWANLEEKATNITAEGQIKLFTEMKTILAIHITVIVVLMLLTLLSGITLFYFSKKLSLKLHNSLIHKIINASLRFFDDNFIGNILNRFSKDLYNIDEKLPFDFNQFFIDFFRLTGALSLIITVNRSFIIPTFILIVIFVGLRHFYLRTGRNLKRLEASTKSPIVGHLSSALEGVTTVRVCEAQNVLKQEFDEHQDLYSSTSFSYQCTFQAFGLCLQFICWIMIVVVVVRFLIIDKGIAAAEVSLAVFQAFTLKLYLSSGICKWTEIENQMTSVERVTQYIETKQEANQGVDLQKQEKPGQIKFENVYLTYDEKNYILKDLNFLILPSEKVAIVGRTGCGKSSLLSLFHRFYKFHGNIFIDNYNIANLTIKSLRANISLVPQNPVIFHATIRDNIDPLGEYSDDQIWNVLEAVNLRTIITALNFEINDNVHFSTGQKQLICLARALIRNNNIVLLDEVCANLDANTQNEINDIIWKKFNDCTVLMVTHDLEAAIKCDKIMLFENAKLIEFEKTSVLVHDESRAFYKLLHSVN